MKSAQLRFYTPTRVGGYEFIVPIDEDYSQVHDLGTVAAASEWSPLSVEIVHHLEEGILARALVPWLSSMVLVLRDEMIARAGPVLEKHGELLELRCSEADLVIFNATAHLDALDEYRSEIERFPSGRIMEIPRLELRQADVGNVQAFKLSALTRSPLIVSEQLANDLARVVQLDGTAFREAVSL